MKKTLSAILLLALLSVCALGQAKTDAGSMFGNSTSGGSGSVTSVDLALPAIFTVTGGPVTTTGTLTGTLATQTANTFFRGPTTGAAAAPTFGVLVDADFSGTSVTLGGNTFSGTGSTIIRQGAPTLTTPVLNTPTISVFSGAQHSHADANGGGQLGISAHASGSLSGNGSKLATVTGSTTSGKCLEWDASGNVVTAASNAACGAGGGGGGTPGGSNGNFQYNNAGSLGGISTANFSAGVMTFSSRVDITTSSDSVRPLAVSGPSTSSFGIIEAQIAGTTFASFSPRRTLNLQVINDPSSPVAGDIWQSGDTNSVIFYAGGLKHGLAGTLFTQSVSRTLTNNITETSLTSTGVGTKTIPASYFLAGKTICYEALGYWSTDASPGTFQFKVKLGSTVIHSTAANTPTASLSNRGLNLSGCITTRTTGGSGTVIGQGALTSAVSVSAGAYWEMVSTGTVTIDTTASQAFDITGTWGTGSVNNSITITNFRLWTHN